MDTVNVRQLKDNPSRALRNTANGPVLVMKGHEPEALLVRLDIDGMTDGDEVRLALATGLFKDDVMSLGRAARVAQVTVSAFATHVSRLGIPLIRSEPSEARADRETLDEWLASS